MIKFKSNYLNKYDYKLIQSKTIKEEDIDQIKNLTINLINEEIEKEKNIILDELKFFNNLENCSIVGTTITKQDIEALSVIPSLKYLSFDFCIFENSLIGNYEALYLNLCSGINIKNILVESLHTLYIVEAKEVLNLNEISKYSNLKELVLLNCELLNYEKILKLESLKTINLSGSNINENFINLLKENTKVIYEKIYRPTGL